MAEELEKMIAKACEILGIENDTTRVYYKAEYINGEYLSRIRVQNSETEIELGKAHGKTFIEAIDKTKAGFIKTLNNFVSLSMGEEYFIEYLIED